MKPLPAALFTKGIIAANNLIYKHTIRQKHYWIKIGDKELDILPEFIFKNEQINKS